MFRDLAPFQDVGILSAGSYVMPKVRGLVTSAVLKLPTKPQQKLFWWGFAPRVWPGRVGGGQELVLSSVNSDELEPRGGGDSKLLCKCVVQLVPTLNHGTQVRSAVKFSPWVCNRGFFGSFQHHQSPSRFHEQRVRLEFEVVTRHQGFYVVPS